MSQDSKKVETPATEIYLHVGNSGATIRVFDAYGPTLEIETSSFGNLQHRFRLATTREGLVAIRDMLTKALETQSFSEPYVHAAVVPNPASGEDSCGAGSCPEDVVIP